MKKYTHAWLAFKAVERLENIKLSPGNQKYAKSLVAWLKQYNDDVIQGAWYPDMVIKDMATSHVLKITPSDKGLAKFRALPGNYLIYQHGRKSSLYKKPFDIDKNTNLPDRCEAIAHSLIDNLKMQEKEQKGSPVSPNNNQIAIFLFMLSHYIADAHVPFHCDSRRFSDRNDIHAYIEGKWDKEIRKYYPIDKSSERFYYNPDSYPLLKSGSSYNKSFLKLVENELKARDFKITWGSRNNNVWDFMRAVCQYSYLLSYSLIPKEYDETNVSRKNWQALKGQELKYKELSVIAFSDAIDSIARVWLRVWRKYMKWEIGQRRKG